jgi:hypothetical protein
MDLLHPNRIQSNQDLLRNDRFGSNEQRDHGYVKRIVLDVASIVTALVASLVVSFYFSDSAGLPVVIAALAAYIVFSYFGALLGGSRTQRSIVILLQAIALVVWLPMVSVALTAVFFVIVLAVLVGSEVALRRELRFVMQIRFFRIARPYISNMVTLSVILMLAFYLPGVVAGKALISPDKLDAFGGVLENTAHFLYPGLPKDPTAGALAETIARQQFKDNPAYVALTPDEQQRAVEQARNQILNEFSAEAGIRVKPGDRFGSLANTLLQNAADRWRVQYGPWFLVFWVVITFLVVRSVGFIFSFLVAFVAYGVYQLLIATGVIVLEGENAMRETVMLT